MPEIKQSKQIGSPLEKVWGFMKDQNNWAPFLMGYQSHEIKDEKESVWRLKSKIAGVTYAFEMKVLITEWIDAQKVGFELKGTTHPVKGGGTFTFEKLNDYTTEVTFVLSLQGTGMATPVVNLVVGPLLQPMADELLDKVDQALKPVTELPNELRPSK
jgi:carbon monoxide dehydrogenase subunit G